MTGFKKKPKSNQERKQQRELLRTKYNAIYMEVVRAFEFTHEIEYDTGKMDEKSIEIIKGYLRNISNMCRKKIKSDFKLPGSNMFLLKSLIYVMYFSSCVDWTKEFDFDDTRQMITEFEFDEDAF